MPKAKKSSRKATSPAKDLQEMEGLLRKHGYDPKAASRLQNAGWSPESLDHALVDGPAAHGLSLAKLGPSPEELTEMQGLLIQKGYDPADAAKLQAEGMGPFELAERLKVAPGAVGSLEYTHRLAKKNPIATEDHHHHHGIQPSILIVLRTEADSTSRTGVSVCAYYKADGHPLQNLHVGGETEFEARSRVLTLYPNATIELEEKKACCASCAAGRPCEGGCHKHKPSVTVESLFSYSKTHVGMAGEPLMAVYEDGQEEEVLGCGACSSQGKEPAAYPTVLRFEKAKRNAAGGYAFETITEVPLSSELQQSYANGACKGTACLPWVRLEKDPQQFRAALQAARKIGPVTKSKVFYALVQDQLVRQDQEVFVILLLDIHMNVRGYSEISRGARDRVLVPIPDVLRLPLVEGATAFVVAHNHPSGKTKPSKADDELTKAIKQGADASGLLFVDHLVIGSDSYYSYSDHGRL